MSVLTWSEHQDSHNDHGCQHGNYQHRDPNSFPVARWRVGGPQALSRVKKEDSQLVQVNLLSSRHISYEVVNGVNWAVCPDASMDNEIRADPFSLVKNTIFGRGLKKNLSHFSSNLFICTVLWRRKQSYGSFAVDAHGGIHFLINFGASDMAASPSGGRWRAAGERRAGKRISPLFQFFASSPSYIMDSEHFHINYDWWTTVQVSPSSPTIILSPFPSSCRSQIDYFGEKQELLLLILSTVHEQLPGKYMYYSWDMLAFSGCAICLNSVL